MCGSFPLSSLPFFKHVNYGHFLGVPFQRWADRKNIYFFKSSGSYDVHMVTTCLPGRIWMNLIVLYWIELYYILFHCILLYSPLLYCIVFYCILVQSLWTSKWLISNDHKKTTDSTSHQLLTLIVNQWVFKQFRSAEAFGHWWISGFELFFKIVQSTCMHT